MTVVPRRKPARPSRGRAPLRERFPRGRKVQVYEDCQHRDYAGRLGTVVSVHEEPEDLYPRGRVEVQLVVDDLYRKLFHPDRPPKTVWFKPNDLEKL